MLMHRNYQTITVKSFFYGKSIFKYFTNYLNKFLHHLSTGCLIGFLNQMLLGVCDVNPYME